MSLHKEALIVTLVASYLWVQTTMGDGDRKPTDDYNRHEHGGGDSHPQCASSTSRTRLHAQVRGLGAFPVHTEVARTIASMRDMCGIQLHGRAIVASAVNTGGVSMV